MKITAHRSNEVDLWKLLCHDSEELPYFLRPEAVVDKLNELVGILGGVELAADITDIQFCTDGVSFWIMVTNQNEIEKLENKLKRLTRNAQELGYDPSANAQIQSLQKDLREPTNRYPSTRCYSVEEAKTNCAAIANIIDLLQQVELKL